MPTNSAASMKARLCEALVTKGLLTKQQVRDLQRDPEAGGRRFGRLLIERGLISEEKLFAVMAEELNLPVLPLAKYQIDAELARLIPERIAKQYTLVPISKLGDRLVVAMADPLNIFALEDLKAVTQYQIDPVLAQEQEIRRAIEQAYGTGGGSVETVDVVDASTAGGDLDSVVQKLLSDETGDVPVVKVINMMIIEALLKRASDIHLEPLAKDLRVRYRIDGRLIESHRLPKAVQSTVLTRLKIMAGMDIAEWRVPQDGRFKIRMEDQEVDFRVSMLPVVHGAKVVMRLLDKKNLRIGLEQLGFFEDSVARFQEASRRPYGMILVTGPTGSGKSTTLYSILTQLNSPGRHITTIEDPVEYQIEGITQVQVNQEIGLTFAGGLRALLRQSPDVVMIGEIRDPETADIALKASLTGQLVLSTLHTNDAASAITRLVDMGVEPFLVASSVSLIEAQRLVRKLCAKCRKAYQPPPEVWSEFGVDIKAGPARPAESFYEAVGCHSCNGTGYRGRLSIAELFLLDERVRELVISRAQSWQIKQHAIEHLGLVPLRQDGLRKAAAGLTTLEEVLQATTEE
jgi:type IV pilus assembly protein PilB